MNRRSLTIVDSLLAKQSNITGVSEILNGCLYVMLSRFLHEQTLTADAARWSAWSKTP